MKKMTYITSAFLLAPYIVMGMGSVCIPLEESGVLTYSAEAMCEIPAPIDSIERQCNPSYIKIMYQDGTTPPIDAQTFSQEALSIQFEVNKTEIAANNPTLLRIIKEAAPLILQQKLQFHHIEVRGGASPEGAYANNVRLSIGRARALLDSVARYIDIPADYVVTQTVAEDYAYLADLIRESNDVDKNEILAAINANRRSESATKLALRQMNGGTTWRRLLKEYYPQLRAARVLFYFSLPEAEPTLFTNTTQAQPMLASLADIQLHLLPVEKKKVSEPMLSVKTNLLYDAFVMPGFGYAPIANVELEYYPHNSRYTVLAEYEFPWWSRDSKHDYFQMLNWQLELRRYFAKNSNHTGHYLSVYAHYNLYDFSFNADRAWQGEGNGAGLGYGYVWPLGDSKRWKLEAFIKVGYYQSQYDPYHAGDPYKGKYYYDWSGAVNKFIRRNWIMRWMGPTGAGITLSYDLLNRRCEKNMNLQNLYTK